MTRLRTLFWVALAVKLLLAAALPLTSDEAYYWVWSQHPQLSYYDHPPVVAWLFYLGNFTRWFPGSVRWPGVVLAHLGLGLWLRILGRWLDERRLFWWLTLALLSPLLGGSALIVTPDVPLLFFYALATLAYVHWSARPDFWRSLSLGLVIGFGLSSKYMMILFPLSVLVPAWRKRETRWGLLLNLPWMILGVVVGTCPVWLWNLTNDFASFKFQARHGLGRKAWKPSWTIEYVALQVALISPIVLYFATRRRRRLPAYFTWLACTPFAFFLITTARGYVEANWPIAAYPAVLALAVQHLPRGRRGLAITAASWGAIFAALASLILIRPEWSRGIKLREFYQYDTVMTRVRDVSPLYARSYQMASKLTFELGRSVPKLRGMTRRDFFDYLPESEPTTPVYFVIAEPNERLPDEYISRGHRIVERTPLDGTYELWKIEGT